MTPNDDTADKSTGSCPVCSADMPADADRCNACGATRGDQHKCPFCGVIAKPVPHDELRLICPACGAPRLPSVASGSAEPPTALRTARSARSSRSVWRVAAGLAAGFGVFATLLLVGVALIANPATFPLIAAGVVTAVPFVFAAFALLNASKRGTQLEQSLQDAWVEAAKQLTAKRGSLRSEQLAQAFGIDASQATDMLAQLAADAEVTTDVTDDGELALSMRVGGLRVANPTRIAQPRDPEPVEVEASAEAEQVTEKAAR